MQRVLVLHLFFSILSRLYISLERTTAKLKPETTKRAYPAAESLRGRKIEPTLLAVKKILMTHHKPDSPKGDFN